MGVERVTTAEEDWVGLSEACRECFRRKASKHPTRPDCSDRDCPPDLLVQLTQEEDVEAG